MCPADQVRVLCGNGSIYVTNCVDAAEIPMPDRDETWEGAKRAWEEENSLNLSVATVGLAPPPAVFFALFTDSSGRCDVDGTSCFRSLAPDTHRDRARAANVAPNKAPVYLRCFVAVSLPLSVPPCLALSRRECDS